MLTSMSASERQHEELLSDWDDQVLSDDNQRYLMDTQENPAL